MEGEADDVSLDRNDEWQELEVEIKRGCSRNKLLGVCRGRPLPSQFRNFVWQHCLDVHGLKDPFLNFDGVYDLPEQSIIRSDCHSLVDKLGNEEEERLSVESDIESTLTLFCKSKNLKYSTEQGWMDILKPLIAAKLMRVDLYNVFCAIIENYIARKDPDIKSQFHLFRLLLLYHDPELCRFLDTKRISPDLFAFKWFSTLFASHCELEVTLNIWDIYFQLSNPFLVHFLALVIVINARDQILCMETDMKEDIAEKLTSFPSALEAEDIEDFCSLAQYYITKTPRSFKQLHHALVYGPQQAETRDTLTSDAKLLENFLCLDVSADEIIHSIDRPLSSIEIKQEEQLKFFVVDCRPAYQFKVGHLADAYHLNAQLMLQNAKEFTLKVQSLLTSPDKVSTDDVTTNTNNVFLSGGEHLCFVGGGRGGSTEGVEGDDDDDNDGYMNMVVAHFLQKHAQYVSICKGGYKAIHDALKSNAGGLLTGHNNKTCMYCCPGNSKEPPANSHQSQQSSFPVSEAFIMEKFGRFSNAFKSTSAILKEKMITYIKNDQVPSQTHVSSTDKVGKRYRNMASVFTIGDDDEEDSSHFMSSEEEVKEMVSIENWVRRFAHPSSAYECLEVLPNFTTKPSLLCLNENHLVVLRKVPDDPGKAWLQNRRSLYSILKITSKKRQPEFITIKYGAGGFIPRPAEVDNKTNEKVNCQSHDNAADDKSNNTHDNNLASSEGENGKLNDKHETGVITISESDLSQSSKPNVDKTNDKGNERSQSHVGDGSITVTAIDRFLIPKAGEATKDIKAHIMKLVDLIE